MLLNASMAQKPVHINEIGVKGLNANVTNAAAKPETFEDMIVAIARTKDKASFIKLFEHFAPRVKSYLMKGGAREDVADELAQETMLNVWNKAESFNPVKAAASTWIFTIARNKKIDSLRRRAANADIELDAEGPNALRDENPSPSESMMRADETTAISEAIKKLPEEQADLIRQSFFEGKSHGEIAAEKKLPLGTVKSRLRLALERLRKEQSVRDVW